MIHPHDILGVPYDCSVADAKMAFRRLVQKCHPDKNPNDPKAAEKFKIVKLAYETIRDGYTVQQAAPPPPQGNHPGGYRRATPNEVEELIRRYKERAAQQQAAQSFEPTGANHYYGEQHGNSQGGGSFFGDIFRNRHAGWGWRQSGE
ncbi:MAG: DnaJ domain-containing protein [Pseudohongiellaceae bacterium]